MISARDSGGNLKPVSEVLVRDRANALRTVDSAFMRDSNNALKQWLSLFTVSVEPASLSSRANSATTVSVTTRAATATAEGAVGTVSYLWSRTDGGAHPWTINSPNSASTTFTTSVAPEVAETATFQCVVSDGAGHSGADSVTASAVNLYFGSA